MCIFCPLIALASLGGLGALLAWFKGKSACGCGAQCRCAEGCSCRNQTEKTKK